VSNALAIAGVTAVLKDLLDGAMIDHNLTSTMGQGVVVSALAPDAIELANDPTRRLNLFLHQATPNAAWRNVGYPSRNSAGERIGNPPLALDLHYLLTAYGTLDLEAEVLLGYAMQVLHETPVLARAAIRTALNPPSPPVTASLLPNIYQALQASDLADQIEQIKITPSVMNTEELSKLWTAFQSHYRPTAPYQVTVVLIESRKPARSPLPVLKRHIEARASMVPPFPEIESIELLNSQIAAQLGELITLHGHDLDGSGHTLLLTNPRLGIDTTIAPVTVPDAFTATLTLPNSTVDFPDGFPAGTYATTLQLVHGSDPLPRLTNQLPLSIAPQMTAPLPTPVNLAADHSLTLTPACAPGLRPDQRVSMILGGHEVLAEPFATTTTAPTFVFKSFAPGKYWVRLRVDGVDSRLIDYKAKPPAFIGQQIEVKP
jgi:Pvc16 N-terminal domain